MNGPSPDPVGSFMPLLILTVIWAVTAWYVAKEKGRRPWLWVIVMLIPVVNFGSFLYLAGARNLRLEKRLDDLDEAIRRLSVPGPEGESRTETPDQPGPRDIRGGEV